MIDEAAISFRGTEDNRLVGSIWDGGGQPVILLHGGGQTRHAWQKTAMRLAERGKRAITIDIRGHGESDWVESGNYSFLHYAGDVRALCVAVERRFGEKPAIVGASLGGLASLLAECREGPLMDALVLVDIVPQMNPAGVARVIGFMGSRMDEGFGSLEEAADMIAAYLPNRKRPRTLDGLSKNLRLGEDGRFRWHWDPAFMRGPTSIDADARTLLGDVVDRLPHLDLPILLVRGMQSELVDEAAARDFVGQSKNARYVDIGGAGHMVAGDRNDVFSQAVIDFFEEQATPLSTS
ncbi:alpha/beta fold hydrolase [Aliihoeflea sp. 40Bstr573]|uniref:alpha/beta fold hydrolase n=1 Tax=Aliihoeflea sp. 40Bstr573 TaxID=2696467 RepID=UPI002095DF55|nr:alpha/beta fold hydrolase [Aliihoeflea sp. 40Bstr573]